MITTIYEKICIYFMSGFSSYKLPILNKIEIFLFNESVGGKKETTERRTAMANYEKGRRIVTSSYGGCVP